MRGRCFLKTALQRLGGRGLKTSGDGVRGIESQDSVGGRIREWGKRNEADELGRQRVGWKCQVHGWGYWVREFRWADDGEE